MLVTSLPLLDPFLSSLKASPWGWYLYLSLSSSAYQVGRIRHVKCDEQKPFCYNCRHTGRACDGYQVGKTGTPSSNLAELEACVIPFREVAKDDRGRRAFHFFRSQLVPELAHAVQTPWHRLLLQACHVDQDLADAVIAVGSLGERFYVNPVLTAGSQYAEDCHFFARRHYQAALLQLQHRIDRDGQQAIDFVLVCCFLFICFEFLQGNDQGVLLHLQNGLNIIKSTSTTSRAEIDFTELLTIPESSSQFRGCILHIFTVLDVQTAVWLSLRSFQLDQMLVRLVGTDPSIVPLGPFKDLNEADSSLKIQINQLYRLRRAISAIDRPEALRKPSQLPSAAIRERQKLILQLSKWRAALSALLEQATTSDIHNDPLMPLETHRAHRVSLMVIHHHVATITAKITLQSAEAEDRLCRQAEHAVFPEMLMLAESLLHPINIMVTWMMRSYLHGPSLELPHPLFHFLPGLIQPLYFTAVKSRHPPTQRRAIALLGKKPWREGAWDSAAMAAIASRRITDGAG